MPHVVLVTGKQSCTSVETDSVQYSGKNEGETEKEGKEEERKGTLSVVLKLSGLTLSWIPLTQRDLPCQKHRRCLPSSFSSPRLAPRCAGTHRFQTWRFLQAGCSAGEEDIVRGSSVLRRGFPRRDEQNTDRHKRTRVCLGEVSWMKQWHFRPSLPSSWLLETHQAESFHLTAVPELCQEEAGICAVLRCGCRWLTCW